jgi:hypothetical protein
LPFLKPVAENQFYYSAKNLSTKKGRHKKRVEELLSFSYRVKDKRTSFRLILTYSGDILRERISISPVQVIDALCF